MDDSLDDYLDFYSSKSTSLNFKKQLKSVDKGKFVGKEPSPEKKSQCEVDDVIAQNSNLDNTNDYSLLENRSPSVSTANKYGSGACTRSSANVEAECEILPNSLNAQDSDVVEVPLSTINQRYNTRSKRKRGRGGANISLPSAPRGRKKRQNLKRNLSDVVIIDESESVNDSSLIENDNYEVTVKVLWKSVDVHRFPIRRYQKLETIIKYFMELEKVPQDKIILTLKGSEIKATDSPDSLNLKVHDFIDGGVLNDSFNNSSQDISNCETGFVLKFQDNSKNIIKLSVSENEKMGAVIARLAEQVEKSIDSIKIYFDGCLVEHTDTANSLDLESGEVLDVKYS